MTAYPYRFRAAEGMYAGTTFVYYAGGTVVSYPTDCPSVWWETPTRWDSGYENRHMAMHFRIGRSRRHDMTPEKLAEFEAIPEDTSCRSARTA